MYGIPCHFVEKLCWRFDIYFTFDRGRVDTWGHGKGLTHSREIENGLKLIKCDADVTKREIEFNVDYWVYLKILSIKGIMRFGKKRKLSPAMYAHIRF